MKIIKLNPAVCGIDHYYAIDFSKQLAQVNVNVRIYHKGSTKYDVIKFRNPDFAVYDVNIFLDGTNECINAWGLYINGEFIGIVSGYLPSYLDFYATGNKTFTISVRDYVSICLPIK